jgi:uncharacterized protein (TIGR00266 family)
MGEVWGDASRRTGAFLGEAPQRGGFGRRAPSSTDQASEGHTLSAAAQKFVNEYRTQPTLMTNDIDFAICGSDIQHVEIELDPGEAVIAENGAMIWKDNDIDLSLVLGDGKDDNASFTSKIVSAGSSFLAGESLYLTEFKHIGRGKAKVALGGKMPGHIVAVRLDAMGGTLICQQNSFLAAAKGVAIGASLQENLTSGLFGGEGLIMQTLTGDGWAFLHIGGTLIERELAAGEFIQVDSGCMVAHEPTVQMNVRFVGGLTTMVAGGEGMLLTVMKGPGKVWIQSLPFARLANETVKAAAPGAGESIGSVVAEVGVKEGFHALKSLW